MADISEIYYKRDFWSKENLKYARPHFRMEKAARLVNRIGRGKQRDLLDVGCGPATLMRLLENNIHYYGIDIAIHDPKPNLRQSDFLEAPLTFDERRFDIVVAQGVFEYAGKFQSQKFTEIKQILKDDGTFVVSYVNFDHRNKSIYWPYNNVQSFASFYSSLAEHFRIRRFFPTSHRWHHDEPSGRLMKGIQMLVNLNIPVISPRFAVEYFFICSRGGSKSNSSGP